MQLEIVARVEREEDEQRSAPAYGPMNWREPPIRPKDILGESWPKDILAVYHEISALLVAAIDRAIEDLVPGESDKAPGASEESVVALMLLYCFAFNQRIGFSRALGSNMLSGPMIRFLTICCEVIGIDLGPASFAKIKQRRFPAEHDQQAADEPDGHSLLATDADQPDR